MSQDEFTEQVLRLRDAYQQIVRSVETTDAPLVTGTSDIIGGVAYYTFWYQLEGRDAEPWAVRLADIPGTLSGDILRFKRSYPMTHTSFEVIGDDIRPLASLPLPVVFPNDEYEDDMNAALAPLPLVAVDPEVHFVKLPKYASEIANNLACLGGTCPGTPKSPRIVPLLGRSSEGELVFPKFNVDSGVLRRRDHSLSTYKTWILDLIDALRCLHSLGIVHRDIRIANFVWTEDSQHLLVCDLEGRWGSCAAPEVQAVRRSIDPGESAKGILDALSAAWTTMSDVYQVGSVIVDIVYAGGRRIDVLQRPVPAPLDKIVAACTRESPQERPTLDELYSMVENMDHA